MGNAEARNDLQLLLVELQDCSRTQNLNRGRLLHSQATAFGCVSSIYVASALINMYSKCGCMLDARQVFDSLEHPNVVAWNALILGYAENGQSFDALDLFRRMKTEGPAPVSTTFLAAIRACTSLAVNGIKRAKKLHKLALKNGCHLHVYVQNALIDMYAKCGSMLDAHRVFDSMKHPTTVSWNTLIAGYAENGQGVKALELFTRSRSKGPPPNAITFLAALKACTSLAVEDATLWPECREWGKRLQVLVVESGCDSDVYVQSTLVDMYAKCGSMLDAYRTFCSMVKPNVISWNVLVMGYADNGKGLTALNLFRRMKCAGLAPDSVTFVAALKACCLVGGLELGRSIHSEINDHFNVVLVTCLVDFYAKCGSLLEAQLVFDSHVETRDMKTWTALIAGFSSSGDHQSAFKLFAEMQDAAGLEPNSVTFVSVLTCCSHAGLVEKGKKLFENMCTVYSIVPTIEHYNCLVDGFGRANRFSDAMALVDRMPFSPNDVTWRTVLSACRKWKNVAIGRLAFQCLIYLDERDECAYVLMGQIYGSRGMMQEQEVVLGMRRKRKPG